jgi:hypothetical protein
LENGLTSGRKRMGNGKLLLVSGTATRSNRCLVAVLS